MRKHTHKVFQSAYEMNLKSKFLISSLQTNKPTTKTVMPPEEQHLRWTSDLQTYAHTSSAQINTCTNTFIHISQKEEEMKRNHKTRTEGTRM